MVEIVTKYMLPIVSFAAAAFSKKLFDFFTERFVHGLGQIKLLDDFIFDYDLFGATYKYYDYLKEGWLDVPFDLEFNMYNEKKAKITFYSPQIKFQLPLELMNDIKAITWQIYCFTSFLQQAVTLDSEKHTTISLRGWVSFFEQDLAKEECKDRLHLIAHNVLSRYLSADLTFQNAHSRVKDTFSGKVRYKIYDGERPVDLSR